MPWPWNSCKNLVKYDGNNISFSGLEGPDEVKFKIAKFQIKKEVLQAACDIAQMYDLFAYRNCERIQQFPKDSVDRSKFILEVTKNEERLLEFIAILKIAIARPSPEIEKALSDWIAFTFTKRLKEEAPIVPEKVRGGIITRESPPIEKYNEIKRSITKAKASSPHMKNALQDPKFDMNDLYVLTTS
jgi:hypothetical protein